MQREDNAHIGISGELSPAILSVLRDLRGVTEHEEWSLVQHKKYLPDLDKAVERVTKAMKKKETIGIFGDYDCDGITGAALLARCLRRHGIEPVVRLPHRVRDGYGLRTGIVDDMALAGVTLLLTVDTGICSLLEIEHGNNLGIDTIILDHHRSLPEVPDAYAILHPILGSDFPLPHPSGAGVAFIFVEAMESSYGTDSRGMARHAPTDNVPWDDYETDLALATIGTVADLVELQGGNRALVRRGLASLAQMKNGPIFDLLSLAGCEGALTSRDIAFRIAPRINAAGRMDDPTIALRSLLGDMDSLTKLDQLNRDRQALTAALWDELLLQKDAFANDRFLCIAHPSYPPGIIGLLAGKLTEAHGKPSLVASMQGEICVASLRSIPGYDIAAALTRVSDLLASYGGHAQAAGCSFALANFQELHGRLQEDITENMGSDDLHPTLLADLLLDPLHVTLSLCEAIQTLEPFGQGNPEPRFIISNVLLTNVRTVGSQNNHLQARIGGHKVIGFGLGHLQNELSNSVDILCTLRTDTWQKRLAPQIVLQDIRTPVGQMTAT